jgi:hypothetical protein
MKLRLALAAAGVAAAVAAAAGIAVPAAQACGWNLGCQTYSPGSGNTGTDLCCSVNEAVNSTFNTYETVLAIRTRAGGGWFGSTLLYYDWTWYTTVDNANSDKVGCYNHHTGSMFVNCRHFNY